LCNKFNAMIFKYELRFVALIWPIFCSLDLFLLFIVFVGCHIVSGICKLKTKKPTKPKTCFCFKSPGFSSPGD